MLEEIERIGADHKPLGADGYVQFCASDGHPWPCAVARLYAIAVRQAELLAVMPQPTAP
jgi:hypothetical protein